MWFQNKIGEIDGKQHNLKSRIEHDRKRDEWLNANGWKIFRIPAKDIKNFLSSLKG